MFNALTPLRVLACVPVMALVASNHNDTTELARDATEPAVAVGPDEVFGVCDA